jgi:Uma2 family endonuclease
MTVLAKPRMNVDQFLGWAVGQPGRYELFRGEVYAMSPETVGHSDRKFAACTALRRAIGERALPCFAVPDGATVRIDEATAYEPDALVYCGQRVSPSAMEIPNPVIVVEVLSPTTRQFDVSIKLAGYFRLPSVAHYLIIEPTQPLIVHHARGPAIRSSPASSPMAPSRSIRPAWNLRSRTSTPTKRRRPADWCAQNTLTKNLGKLHRFAPALLSGHARSTIISPTSATARGSAGLWGHWGSL